ncbi:MAG: hypothetical protein IT210_13605 [Armatimonadetes bacterium]|nr:hypothetical protein [Armatimonadota bacterium]
MDVLIREFNAVGDVEYAGHIYDLVKNHPAGWRGGPSFVLVTALMTLAGVSWT